MIRRAEVILRFFSDAAVVATFLRNVLKSLRRVLAVMESILSRQLRSKTTDAVDDAIYAPMRQ